MASYPYTPRRPAPHPYFSNDGFGCIQCQLPKRNSVHDVAQQPLPTPVLDPTGTFDLELLTVA